MELETINKLFLELSQVTTAKTKRELQLEHQLEYARKQNEDYVDLLNSACAIADREGRGTHWGRWRDRLRQSGINGHTARVFRILEIDAEQDFYVGPPGEPPSP